MKKFLLLLILIFALFVGCRSQKTTASPAVTATTTSTATYTVTPSPTINANPRRDAKSSGHFSGKPDTERVIWSHTSREKDRTCTDTDRDTHPSTNCHAYTYSNFIPILA